MIPQKEETQASREMANLFKRRLDKCLEKDEQGRPRLTVTLPDGSALERLTASLARLAGV